MAWTGDFNNVLASWIHAAARLDFTINVATPRELAPPDSIIDWARENGARLNLTTDAREAVSGVDAVVTDCWVSMGDEDEGRRHNLLQPLPGSTRPDESRRARRPVHALPARPSRRGGDRRDHGRAAFRRLRRGRKTGCNAQKGVLAWCFGLEGQAWEAA